MTDPVPAPISAPAQSTDKLLIILCHLSLMFGMGFLLPFIIYLATRNSSELVAAHAREVLNFHLSLLIYILICIPLVIFLLGIPFLIILALVLMAFICAIIGALKASDGGFYRYPLTIRMIR